MRILLGILLCLSLISCERIYAPNENQADNLNRLNQDAYPNPDSTFNVHNETGINVGSVNIHLTDSTITTINVSDSGHFSSHINAAPSLCFIHGYPLLYSASTWIPIDSHISVRATWTSNVIVIDQSEEN